MFISRGMLSLKQPFYRVLILTGAVSPGTLSRPPSPIQNTAYLSQNMKNNLLEYIYLQRFLKFLEGLRLKTQNGVGMRFIDLKTTLLVIWMFSKNAQGRTIFPSSCTA